jgi:hypothetical protein
MKKKFILTRPMLRDYVLDFLWILRIFFVEFEFGKFRKREFGNDQH